MASPSPPSLETPTGSSAYLSDNRINGRGYDNAGNILSIANVTRSFTYDAENRQKTATINGIVTTYAYDGEGRRITKTNQGVTTTSVYDAMGNLAVEYGALTAPADESGTRYLFTDHLGSTRLLSNIDGSQTKPHDYLPFEDEITTVTPLYPQAGGPNDIKFTSKERDAETGLDYFEDGRYSCADQHDA